MRIREMTISVVIPTAREKYPKRGCLHDLIAPLLQKIPLKEVVLVGRWNKEFLRAKLDLPLVRIERTHLERSYLRNVGVRHSSGTHILFLDDDTIPLLSPGFRRQLEKLPKKGMLTLATRRYIGLNVDLKRMLEKVATANWNRSSVQRLPRYHRDDEIYSAGITFCTNFGIVDKQSFQRVGGFDEKLQGWGFEDVDFMNRILRVAPIISCRRTATAVHIDHLIQPDKMEQARRNHRVAARKCSVDPRIPNLSSSFYGIAAEFVNRIEPCEAPTKEFLKSKLNDAPHFEVNRRDIRTAVGIIHRFAHSAGLLALTIHGSATRGSSYRDVDMCAITGTGRDFFKVVKLPSGYKLELQIVPLFAIRRHLEWLKHHPETAFLNWSKWSGMKFLYDHQGVVARFLGDTMRKNRNAMPFMMSFSVGEAWTLLQKRDALQRMSAARHCSAVSSLANLRPPPASSVLNGYRTERWLRQACARLRKSYRWWFKQSDRDEVLVYPANIVGHRLIVGEE